MFGFNKAPDVVPVVATADGSVAPITVDGTVSPKDEAPTVELEGLDRIQKMLDNDPTNGKSDDPDHSSEDMPFNPVELLNNPEMMDKITAGLDFSSAISSETQQKLADNSPDAIISLVQDVGKMAYTTSIKHSSVLAQQALDDRMSRLTKDTDERITRSLSKHELQRELPNLNNPLVAMAVEGFQAKLQSQNPSMTTEQVAQETKNYVTELANSLNPSSPSAEEKKANEEVDWMAELGLG